MTLNEQIENQMDFVFDLALWPAWLSVVRKGAGMPAVSWDAIDCNSSIPRVLYE